MESLVKSIASANLGPKWKQLYSRLGLGPSDRYRFESRHGSEAPEEQTRCCVIESIEKWRSTVAKDTDEKEAMKQLLCVLEKVKGFKELANQLADANDIILHPPLEDIANPTLPKTTPPQTRHNTSLATKKTSPASSSPPAKKSSYPDSQTPPGASPNLSVRRPSRAVEVQVNHADFGSDRRVLPRQNTPLTKEDASSTEPLKAAVDTEHLATGGSATVAKHPSSFRSELENEGQHYSPNKEVFEQSHLPAGDLQRFKSTEFQSQLQDSTANQCDGALQKFPPLQDDFFLQRRQVTSVPLVARERKLPEDQFKMGLNQQSGSSISEKQFVSSSLDDEQADSLYGDDSPQSVRNEMEGLEIENNESESSFEESYQSGSVSGNPRPSRPYLHRHSNSSTPSSDDPDTSPLRHRKKSNHKLLRVQINLTDQIHKFALLDVCQRLPLESWQQLSQTLEISEVAINRLQKQKAIEERFYLALKEWISCKGGGATFGDLEDVLRTCGQERAIGVMRLRLQRRNVEL